MVGCYHCDGPGPTTADGLCGECSAVEAQMKDARTRVLTSALLLLEPEGDRFLEQLRERAKDLRAAEQTWDGRRLREGAPA